MQDQPDYQHPATKARRDHWKVPGEVGPTWLLDARRFAGFTAIIACEMPAGRPLELDIREGSLPETIIGLLSHISARRGYPERVLLDNAGKFHSSQVEWWCSQQGISIEYLPTRAISAVAKRLLDRLSADIKNLGRNPAITDCRKAACTVFKNAQPPSRS
jgi:hypothetical protein